MSSGASAFHVERDLALALLPEHAVVIGAGQHHRPQPAAQRLRRQLRVPRADRRALVIEDADQLVGERVRLLRRNVDIGSLDRGGGKPGQITEIGRLVGVGDMLRDMQPQSRPLALRFGLARTGSRGWSETRNF